MVIPKKLFQGYLDTTVKALYTTPSGKFCQVIDIWIDNQNVDVSRFLSIYTGGLTLANRMAHNIEIQKNSSMGIHNNKIILNEKEILAMNQDIGTDILVTIYGIEEDII